MTQQERLVNALEALVLMRFKEILNLRIEKDDPSSESGKYVEYITPDDIVRDKIFKIIKEEKKEYQVQDCTDYQD